MRGRILFLVSLLTICLLGVQTPGQDSEIMAKIGDEIITKLDLDVMVRRLTMGGVPGETPQAKAIAEDKKEILKEAVNLTLLAREAKKTDLMNDPILKAKIRVQVNALIVEEYVNHYIDSLIPVSENEILDFYKATPKYQQKEIIRARHILVKTEEEAKEILSRIKSGEDFSKLAMERSKDGKTREMGGDLGWFERGRAIKPFEEAAFSLKEGEVSDVVKTLYGYHIIKLENRKIDPPIELEKVRPEITKEIKTKKKREFIEKKLEGLRASTPIEILSDKYKDQK